MRCDRSAASGANSAVVLFKARAPAFDPLRTFKFSAHKAGMRILASLAATVLLGTVASCATSASPMGRCAAISFQQLVEDPLPYVGSWYCGEGLVAKRGSVIQIVRSSEDLDSYDTVLLATSATSSLFGEIGARPERYYLEARIDPQVGCFQPVADNGESCVPWRRPVFMHIRRAARLR